jgi:class 3 adenylate cyclase
MTEPLSLPLSQASVLFLKIQAFTTKVASQQARQREQLDATLAAAAAVWPDNARLVLDAPDGAAIVALGDPGLALDAASRVRQTAHNNDLLIGLHHGPVKSVQGKLMGEGIDTAASVAEFATGRQVMVSASYRDALARWWPRRARTLEAAGEFVDGHLRSYSLFGFDPALAQARERRRTVMKVAGVIGILSAGVAARVVRERIEAANKPSVIALDVQPWGDVYVDGELKGKVPPLSRLWIKPGLHTIEVRNGKSKPFVFSAELKPGEEVELKHAFSSAPAKSGAISKKRRLWDRLKFW